MTFAKDPQLKIIVPMKLLGSPTYRAQCAEMGLFEKAMFLTDTAMLENGDETKKIGEVITAVNGGIMIRDIKRDELWYIQPELLWESLNAMRTMIEKAMSSRQEEEED